MSLEKLVAKARELRDEKKRVADLAKQATARIDSEMGAVHTEIISIMKQTGQESARTAAGTATLTTKRLVGLSGEEDAWDAFTRHVVKHDAWHLLQKRPADGGCKEWEAEHGSLPPGIATVREELTVGIRAPVARRK